MSTSARSRYLLERAVAGIGHYGNSIGIATVGGEIYFEGPYEQNCLVNAMALGLIETDKLIRSRRRGRREHRRAVRGQDRAATGSAARRCWPSAELDDSEDKRPTVQIGDPFTEKKLLECSLDLLDRGLLVALQDLGAAGLTSSSAEMAAKGEVGLDLDVRLVPLREADMEPFEIMVSESQERMLCVVEPEQLAGGPGGLRALGGQRHRDRRGHRHAPPAGLRRRRAGRRHARHRAGGRVPGLRPRARRARDAAVSRAAGGAQLRRSRRDPARAARVLQRRLAQWAFEQYDSIVGSRTVRRPETADAAVLMLPSGDSDPLTVLYPDGDGGARPAIAVAIDGNGRRVAADPYRGAVEAVLECSANLACVGAEPLGLTNCLNFGNPEKPHIAWQFTRAIAGLGDACRAFGIPVVGGNVSLYNEGGEGPIYPTPVVGLVGELPDARRAGRLGFVAAGDSIALVTAGWAPSPAASELSKLRGEAVAGPLPARRPRRGQGAARRDPPGGPLRRPALRARRRRGRRRGRAGRVVLASGLGASVSGLASEAELFGEGPGAFLVSGPARGAGRVRRRRAGHRRRSAATPVTIEGVLDVPLDELDRAFTYGLADLLTRASSHPGRNTPRRSASSRA